MQLLKCNIRNKFLLFDKVLIFEGLFVTMALLSRADYYTAHFNGFSSIFILLSPRKHFSQRMSSEP